jgi:hypothetical protein
MTRSLRSTAALTLAAAALAAPSASARPADPSPHKPTRAAHPAGLYAPRPTQSEHKRPQPGTPAAVYPTRPAQGEQAFPKPDPPLREDGPAQPTADRGPDWTTLGLGISGGLLLLAAAVAGFAHHGTRGKIAV